MQSRHLGGGWIPLGQSSSNRTAVALAFGIESTVCRPDHGSSSHFAWRLSLAIRARPSKPRSTTSLPVLLMIRRLEPGDATAVATLHQETLRSRMTGLNGRRLLSVYYRVLALGKGGCGYVAVGSNGEILGFVCGIWDPAALREVLIRSYWGRLAVWGGLHALSRPIYLRDVYRRVSSRSTQEADSHASAEYELRPIAVRGDRQGSGVADQLMQKLLEDARIRDFRSVTLKTESDNGRANAFYARQGFTLERTADGYNHYRRRLES